MKQYIYIIFFVLIINTLYSSEYKDTLRPRYGATIGYNYNIHTADFRALPGVPNCCPIFEQGSGFGPLFSILYEHPLSNKFIFGINLGYNFKSGILKKEETTPVSVNMSEVQGKFEHSIDARITTVFFEPAINYRIFDKGFVFAAFQGGFFLEKHYEQKEEIIEPKNTAVFIDTKTRIRNNTSGDIPNMASFDAVLKAGINYELPLNTKATVLLVPQLSVSYGVLNIVEATSWKIANISFGVSIKFNPYQKLYLKKRNYIIDTLKFNSEAVNVITCNHGVNSIKNRKEFVKDTVYTIEDVFRTDTLLMPYNSVYSNLLNIDTISIKSEFVNDTVINIGKEKTTMDKLIEADTIRYITTIHRTDTLFTPYNKNIKLIQQNDTLKLLSDLYMDSTFIEGKTITLHKTDIVGDTLVDYEILRKTDTLYIPNIIDKSINISDKKFTRIAVYGIIPSGKRVPINNITLKIQYVSEVYPLLPYVFFKQNSSEIPSRYNVVDIGNYFDLEDLEPNPLVYHRNNLNIIAKRLIDFPDANISVAGYIDPSTELGNYSLAINRANRIKKYFVENWNIDSSRIIINTDTNYYPKDITKTQNEDGYSENRRVEIFSDNQKIIAAVQGKRYQNPVIMLPQEIEFDPTESIIKNPKRWILNVSQSGRIILNKSISDSLYPIRYKLTNSDIENLTVGVPIRVELKVFDKNDKLSISLSSLDVYKDTDEYELERLSLNLFEVSKNQLSNSMKMETSKFIEKLNVKSIINVRGYTDNLGNEKANQQLSELRAKEISNFIKQKNTNARIANVIGLGANQFPSGILSYFTPEERFLSRTVEITIRKPLVME